MRLMAFILLLVAAVFHQSLVRASRNSPDDVLTAVIPELRHQDFYPVTDGNPVPEIRTEFDDHWLQGHSPEIFEGLESIHVLNVRKSQPIGRDYYPEVVLEIWVYESDEQPVRTVSQLDSLQDAAWVFKTPADYWSQDEWFIYTHTRAEMFQPYLEDATEALRDLL
jgi:hypothetical protein